MSEITKEKDEKIEEKLEYIGLDLTHIPDIFKNYAPLEYRPLKSYSEKGYKVYRYIPICDIQILLTPTNRLNTIQEKYAAAAPISFYLNPTKEEDIVRHATFLKMVKDMQIDEIEAIENEQKKFEKQLPFKVKFHDNYLWQIYYSDTTDTYFMLVPTEDLDYSMLFYLIKKQIECSSKKIENKIYVPICQENYSMQYLKKSEISDIEKYLWLFTKQWPLIYEVYDIQNNLSIQIVGEINCYETIKSFYKIKLESKEDASKFYKLIKALFILQTELPHRYHFQVKIDEKGGLEFERENHKITYAQLAPILNKEYKKVKEEILQIKKEQLELIDILVSLKQEEVKKEGEYLEKEKEIATYLECRKTFLGKVRYFFKAKKNKNKTSISKIQEQSNLKTVEKMQENELPQNIFMQKEYYTIEDILTINEVFEKIEKVVKNDRLDVEALKNKIQNLECKIRNATQYIEEIDRHEKSIFEFWKFANKDEKLLLNPGEMDSKIEQKAIEKVFDLEQDREEVGRQIDRQQRKLLSKEEADAIFLTTTNVLSIYNQLENEQIISESLEQLKQQAEEERILFHSDTFDIFGGITEDKTKIRTLGNQKHRENEKDTLKILEITKNTTMQEYKDKLKQLLDQIKKAFSKNVAPFCMSVYYTQAKEDRLTGLQVFDMNPENAIKVNRNEENVIYLYRLNIAKGIPTLYFSNSVYFDNYNKTLPYGMDIEMKCLLDMERLSLELVKRQEIRINESIDIQQIKTKKVYILEYEVKEKETND